MHNSRCRGRLDCLSSAAKFALLDVAVWIGACAIALCSLFARTDARPFDLLTESSAFGGAFVVAGSFGYASSLRLGGRPIEAVGFLVLTAFAVAAMWLVGGALGNRMLWWWGGLPPWVVGHAGKQTLFGMVVGGGAGAITVITLALVPLLAAWGKTWPAATLMVFAAAVLGLAGGQTLIGQATEVLFHWQRSSHWAYSQAIFGSVSGAAIGCVTGPSVGMLVVRMRQPALPSAPPRRMS